MDYFRKFFLTSLIGLSFLVSIGCTGVNIPTPSSMTGGLEAGASAEKVLTFFDSIPYREDGAINKDGDFTLFADQQARFDTPGLNCSGFTVAASRYFFKRDYVLNDVMIDRLADSGPDAELGEDWDFGYDVILNLTEGMDRKIMLPFGKTVDISSSNAMSLRGFDLHDLKAWADVISKMKKGKVYLFSMSKPVSFKNYKVLHYHVGVIVPDGKGHVWLCHATHKSGVNKVDISSTQNLKRVVDANPDSKLGKRMILIVEAPLK
jgi:hypothetical protein